MNTDGKWSKKVILHLDLNPHHLKKAKKKKRKAEYNFIVIRSRDGYLLELRDSNGIWPGLWSFPALEVNEKIGTWIDLNVGINEPYKINYMDQFTHSLSHIEITINPILIDISEYTIHEYSMSVILTFDSSQSKR